MDGNDGRVTLTARSKLVVAMTVVATACGGSGGAPPGDAAVDAGMPIDLFDPAVVQRFELEVVPADWQWLLDHARDEQYVPATFVFGGQRYTSAAVRFKGDYGTLLSCFDEVTGQRICDKLSLKISFNEYGPGRFLGLRKLILNSSVRDPSMVHEVLAYGMYRAAGLAAPRATHATIKVNGESLGLFVLVENLDKEFLEDHFANPEGNLYKGVWPQYATPTRYVAALTTNETVANVSRMLAFHAAIAGATDTTFAADIAPFLDLDQLARYLAADRVVNSPDGIRGFYCYESPWTECENSNYYWYETPGGKLTLIPWDVDYTFDEIDQDLARSYADTSAQACTPVPSCVYWNEPGCDPATETVYLRAPQCDSLYGMVHRSTATATGQHMRTLLDTAIANGKLLATHAALVTKVRGEVAIDPHGPGLTAFDDANMSLDDVIAGQETEVRARLTELGL